MALSSNIKRAFFWRNVLKIGAIFFVSVTLISLCFNSFSDLIAGNWGDITDRHFKNQKWIRFLSSKLIAGFVYGVYMTNKKMK